MASAQAIPSVALVSHSSAIKQSDLASYVAAYQDYVDDWLGKHYSVRATIVASPDGSEPPGAWIMYFEDKLKEPGAAGFHTDSRERPVAYIDAHHEPLFTGSHELAEMLVDPSGNSLYGAPSPDPAATTKDVQILDEVCDPCEDTSFAISVHGVPLSDFITSSYGTGTAGPYDAAGKLTAPREVAVNGYISWIDGADWKQATNFAGHGFAVRVLGPADQPKREGKSLREWVDEQTRRHVAELGLELPRSS
jgi:hypothetical protein